MGNVPLTPAGVTMSLLLIVSLTPSLSLLSVRLEAKSRAFCYESDIYDIILLQFEQSASN